ncbi:hypothetical protein [uncultured Clostridium sp.]|uniref:hypothetical protein n=1 Tax=uncultured Clostridium sp. TaxID=59620 RepID=UPI003216D929
MTTQELINILEKTKDKSKPIGYMVNREFKTLDSLVGVCEWEDMVELQYELEV